MVQINKSSSAKVQPLTCPGLSTRSASWAQLMKTIYSVAAATVVTQTLRCQCTRLRGIRGHHVHCRLVLPEKIWDAPKYCTGCTYVETSLAVYLKFWASCIFICKSGNLTPFTGTCVFTNLPQVTQSVADLGPEPRISGCNFLFPLHHTVSQVKTANNGFAFDKRRANKCS